MTPSPALSPSGYLHDALPALLNGNDRLRLGLVRRAWNPPYHTGYIVLVGNGYLMARSADGQKTDYWYPTVDDVMASDWEIWEVVPANAGIPAKKR